MTGATEYETENGTLLDYNDFYYDAFGNLVAKYLTHVGDSYWFDEKFLYDLTSTASGVTGNVNNLWAELDGGSEWVVIRYLNGIGENNHVARTVPTGTDAIDEAWMITDRQGSVRALLDLNGNLAQEIDYTASGITSISHVSPYSMDTGNILYAGYRYDYIIGLYQTHWRWYNPETGGWTSEDPIGIVAGDPNFYRYVGNNGLNGVDPSGLEDIPIIKTSGRRVFEYTNTLNDIFYSGGDAEKMYYRNFLPMVIKDNYYIPKPVMHILLKLSEGKYDARNFESDNIYEARVAITSLLKRYKPLPGELDSLDISHYTTTMFSKPALDKSQEIRRQLRKITPKLGAEDFNTRIASELEIEELWKKAVRHKDNIAMATIYGELDKIVSNSIDVEASSRAKMILKRTGYSDSALRLLALHARLGDLSK